MKLILILLVTTIAFLSPAFAQQSSNEKKEIFSATENEESQNLTLENQSKKLTDVPEQMGFGLVPSRDFNPVSGELTSKAYKRLRDKYAEERKKELTLFDDALTLNTFYNLGKNIYIRLSTAPEDNFDYANFHDLLDDVPSQYHKSIAQSDSAIEAFAMKESVIEHLKKLKKLEMLGFHQGD